jgi:hypothetical protein
MIWLTGFEEAGFLLPLRLSKRYHFMDIATDRAPSKLAVLPVDEHR